MGLDLASHYKDLSSNKSIDFNYALDILVFLRVRTFTKFNTHLADEEELAPEGAPRGVLSQSGPGQEARQSYLGGHRESHWRKLLKDHGESNGGREEKEEEEDLK